MSDRKIIKIDFIYTYIAILVIKKYNTHKASCWLIMVPLFIVSLRILHVQQTPLRMISGMLMMRE